MFIRPLVKLIGVSLYNDIGLEYCYESSLLAVGLDDVTHTVLTWNVVQEPLSLSDFSSLFLYFDSVCLDFMIGGILAWDGQLRDTNRYTWDLDAELQYGETDDFTSSVAVLPSMSLEDRRLMAVDFVRSTEFSPTYQWIDDRRCPFTGNAIITLGVDLAYPESVFGERGTPEAFGTVSPIASNTFYDFVDEILIEGGWEFGAGDGIHNRTNPCMESGFINRTSEDWSTNLYYSDIMDWRSGTSDTMVHDSGPIFDEEDKPSSDPDSSSDESSDTSSSTTGTSGATRSLSSVMLALGAAVFLGVASL